MFFSRAQGLKLSPDEPFLPQAVRNFGHNYSEAIQLKKKISVVLAIQILTRWKAGRLGVVSFHGSVLVVFSAASESLPSSARKRYKRGVIKIKRLAAVVEWESTLEGVSANRRPGEGTGDRKLEQQEMRSPLPALLTPGRNVLHMHTGKNSHT